MLNISRKLGYPSKLRCLTQNCRTIYSGRISQCLQYSSQNSTDEDGSSKAEGYGEKEIFLLGPLDTRTPLPGNTGIPPLSMLHTDFLRQPPKYEAGKNDLISSELPEERYKNALSQVAFMTIEKVLFQSSMLECVAHECPQLLKKDFSDLFPDRNINSDNLTVMTLCQKTENDMSEWSEIADLEREHFGQYFIIAAQAMCANLRESGYWADFIHPNTGKLNVNQLSTSTMMETDLRYRHFGFSIEDLGCCKVISHFTWGTHACVGAIFTNAPLGSIEIKEIIEKMCR